MKALILAGGRGKRLGEHTEALNKCMVAINGRPAIEYSLEYAMHDAIDEIVVIVGYRAEDIINTYGASYKGKKIKYVIQAEQRGLVHAIECAKEALDGQDFMLFLGDEVFSNPRHDALLVAFLNDDTFVICGMILVEDKSLISKTYSALFDKDDVIQRLIEKPVNPPNNMMGTGNCAMRNEIFDYISRTPVHFQRKEKELPDLIQCAIDDGKRVRLMKISDKYVNINMREDLARAKELLEN